MCLTCGACRVAELPLDGLDKCLSRPKALVEALAEAKGNRTRPERPHSVQSESEVSPTPGVESALTSLPSGSMMNSPGAEATM